MKMYFKNFTKAYMGDREKIHLNHIFLSQKVNFFSTGDGYYEEKHHSFSTPCRYRSLCANYITSFPLGRNAIVESCDSSTFRVIATRLARQ